MLAVVQTYPAHFYQTLLCLKSIHQHVQNLDDVILIIDDRSPLCWPSYVKDCGRLYSGLVGRTILTSTIPTLRFLHRYPWLRQQTTKLLLDTVIDQPHWLFIDGDIRLISAPPVDSIAARRRPYVGVPLDQRDPGPGEMSSQVLYYIRYMLDIDFLGFWDDEDSKLMITASHPPVHVMRADLLQKLRASIETRFGSPLAIVHKNIAQDTRMAACEWDLIECFRQTVMKESANWNFNDGFCEATWSSDRELGRSWFETRGIGIDDGLWKILPEVKYL